MFARGCYILARVCIARNRARSANIKHTCKKKSGDPLHISNSTCGLQESESGHKYVRTLNQFPWRASTNVPPGFLREHWRLELFGLDDPVLRVSYVGLRVARLGTRLCVPTSCQRRHTIHRCVVDGKNTP